MSEAEKRQSDAWEALKMWEAGITNIPAIAGEIGRSEEWTRRSLQQQGVKIERARGVIDNLSDVELADIKNRYAKGERVNEICKTYHIAQSTLYRLFDQLGIPPRTRSREAIRGKVIQEEVAVKMYEEGWVLWYISEESGLPVPSIMKAVRKAGLKLRGRGARGKYPAVDPETGDYVLEEADDG